MTRRLLLALGALLLGVSGLVGVEFSSAEFSDTSQTPVQVTAAPDWTPPTVAVVDPGYAVSGTVTVAATASDAVSDLVSVEIQYRPSGGAWTSLCVDTAAPWSCSWDTTVLPDGPHGLRAVAVDSEGNTETSAVVDTEVVNTAAVVIDPVPSPVRGTITLTAGLVNVPINSWATITFQASVAGTNDWYDLPGCSGPGPEASCLFDTTASSGTFDLRAVGRLPGNTWFYDVQTGIVVDNDLPEVGLTVPASPLAGTVGLTATASDALSGLAGVLVEYRLQGGGWLGCGAGTGSPYTCEVDTAALADGSYEFRATATDAAGNSRTTDPVTRVVDNLVADLSLAVPAGPLTGSVVLTAATSDPDGFVSVDFRYRVQGSGVWASCGIDLTAPYSCAFDTLLLTNGTYELQALGLDSAGRSTLTDVATRTVMNVPTVTVTTPTAGAVIARGATVSLGASVFAPNGVTSVTLQYDPAGAATWTTVCVDGSAPFTCAWNTSTVPVRCHVRPRGHAAARRRRRHLRRRGS